MADHPRIRGEHLQLRGGVIVSCGSSPHTRGARPGRSRPPDHGGIIPAYAGSTIPYFSIGSRSPDHPRIRGEHTYANMEQESILGSSPHTRGALCLSISFCSGPRIIPAYAGSTDMSSLYSITVPDHPRIRGEHRISVFLSVPGAGSSPHTRGAPSAPWWRHRLLRIIPAYAGSTLKPDLMPSQSPDHPRIRGEHALTAACRSRVEGSSPHTRGARYLVDLGVVRTGIIPAYAGSTSTAPAGSSSPADHPRIRGEHPWFIDSRGWLAGSSPHTRGARQSLAAFSEIPGIIPAYAGSTLGS